MSADDTATAAAPAAPTSPPKKPQPAKAGTATGAKSDAGTKKEKGKKSKKRPAPPLPPALHEWRILVRRIATAVGALCGLVSLLFGAPAWVACVRGGATSFLIAVLGRQGERFLTSSDEPHPADDGSETPSTSAPAGTPPADAGASA